jgi:hypothetical protein
VAQVDAEFLRLVGALAPDSRGLDAARHGGNCHAGAKPEGALQDRIAPGEQHASPRILGTAAEGAHEVRADILDREIIARCCLGGSEILRCERSPDNSTSCRL